MKTLTRPNRANGFTLVELAIAIAISALIISGGLAFQLDTVRKQQASAQGDQIKTLNGYVATYETNYYGNLVNGTPIAGVSNEYAPTVAELKTIGVIPASFNATNLYGGGFTISVSKTPTSCVAPNCDITGTVALNNVIKNPVSGTPDYPLLGTAASEAGGDAGFSDSGAPANITGPNGTFTLANPNGAIAGILGMRSGYGSSGFSQFLRRDGSLPMLGNLDMGNNNVTNAATVTATGLTVNGNASITGSTTTGTLTSTGATTVGSLISNGNVSVTGNITDTGGIASTGNITTSSALLSNTLAPNSGTTLGLNAVTTNFNGGTGIINAGNINGSNITATGNVSAAGTTSGGYLKANNTITAGAACSPNGIVGEDAANALYSCQSGTWKQATGSNGGVIPASQQPSTFSGHPAYTSSGYYYTSGYALYFLSYTYGNSFVCGNFTSNCSIGCNVGFTFYSQSFSLNTTGIVSTGGGPCLYITPVGNYPWS